ncbi:hypothetical protein HHI36_007340 [Cryptolaemus montrouzieri]|uniref:URB1 N-terminal domain-containing protein n=1 Tax=Cryptolaemus montrouzieri TaxID=559131 RepID=A0ABD2MP90_9CUCU
MILCTSHKYGVIFRDPLVGMGKKTQNALIFTVLDSMDSPWDHSYASELVIKICSACPDLTKYVWNNLKEALELRYSEKWLKVVNFVKRLIAKLQPSCLEPYVKNLNINQISQLITILVAPLPILKIMIPENCTYELQIIRYNAITLILSFSKSIFSFIEACEKWLNKEQLDKLKIQLETYVERNFPRSETLLKNWNEQDKTEESTGFNPLQYLSSVCDILECYITLSPGLLESLKFSHSDLKILLETIDSISTDSNEETGHLKIKIVDLFLYVNPSVFALTSDSFIFFLSFLLKASHQDVQIHDFRSLTVLKKFLKNTGIFDYGFEKEVNIWINGIFSLKIFNENISSFFGETIRLTHSKIDDYLKILSSIQQEIKIKNESSKYNDNLPLSPMLLGILEYSGKIDIEKTFHLI